MLKNLNIRTQLIGLMLGMLGLLVIFSGIVWVASGGLSTAAEKMGQGKDVVADILPPPLYVIEAQLTVLQLQKAGSHEAPQLLGKLAKLKQEYDDRNTYWVASDLDAAVKQSLLGEQKKAADHFWKLALGDYAAAINQGDAEQIQRVADEVTKAYMAHRAGVDTTVGLATSYANQTLDSLHSESQQMRLLVLILAGGGGFLIVLVMGMVIREIMRRLGGEPRDMQSAAQQIAEGNLTLQLRPAQGDNSSLLVSIIRIQTNLRDTIAKSRQTAQQIAGVASTLAANTQLVSKSSAQQGQATTSMAAAIEQMTACLGQMADSASNARSLAEETGKQSTEGKQLMADTVNEVNRVADSVARSSSVIATLGEQSGKISNIVNVIKEIADQTNLLALNAAIEAARAGEQGRGFAVVADEVRKLAERTTSSTLEIKSMIDAIQHGTHSAVLEMESGSKLVTEGVNMAARTGHSMQLIEVEARQVLDAVDTISNALREQSLASTEISKNVETVADMAEDNAAAVTAVSRSASELEQLANDLKHSVDHFHTS